MIVCASLLADPTGSHNCQNCSLARSVRTSLGSLLSEPIRPASFGEGGKEKTFCGLCFLFFFVLSCLTRAQNLQQTGAKIMCLTVPKLFFFPLLSSKLCFFSVAMAPGGSDERRPGPARCLSGGAHGSREVLVLPSARLGDQQSDLGLPVWPSVLFSVPFGRRLGMMNIYENNMNLLMKYNEI